MELVALSFKVAARMGAHTPPRRGSGQSTVEYALVGALVVIAAAGALSLLGTELSTVFTNISNTLRTAASAH